VSDILTDLLVELSKADQKYGPMQEMVEGLYTIRCELEELSREVMRYSRSKQEIRKEATQVGAMAIKFLRDCCNINFP
jgi:hypothetical protein